MIETWFTQDINSAVQVRTINGNVFSMDNNGNKIGVRVTNGGAPVALTGTISANVIRADGATVAVAGSKNGNEAWVVLPQACYAVPGVITIIIKNTVSSDVTTLLAVMANVYQSSTDTAVDPGTIITSIQALIDEIEDAESTIPQDYSDLSFNMFNINKEPYAYTIAWEQGSFNSGGDTVSSIRIRTKYIDVEKCDAVAITAITSGYLYELDTYDANKTVIDSISWNNSTRNVDMTGVRYIRLILCKSGNTNIVPTEGVNITVKFTPAIDTRCVRFGEYVNSTNMSSVLPDADDAEMNKYYTLRFTEEDMAIPDNLPFETIISGLNDYCVLVCLGDSSYKEQILIDRAANIYTRLGIVSTSYWFGWKQPSNKAGELIHVGTGYAFTKLTDAIKYAFEHPNTTVMVHPGTYDIITEMGADYWSDFSGYSDLTHAKIGNGAHFIFCADSKVVCNYTGNNTNVNTLYSPFNSLDSYEGDFTIEGMVLEVSGCRYTIHDDVGASTVEQTHRYINCDITNDKRCIGAGLGANETVEMRDCVFRSTGAAGNNPVSWHNSGGGTTGKGSIVMTGCYVTGAGNNTAQFLAYGSSQKLSRVLVSNNRFTAAPICQKYDETIPYMNFEMLAFNNTIDT